MDNTSSLDGWASELRSGILPLAVLAQLKSPQYSSSLIQVLEQRGLLLDPGALAPLLRRLEKQKLLTGNWDQTGNRPRKYYALSEAGAEALKQLNGDWQNVMQELQQLIEGDGSQ
ncbi:PadR family transcriptional regulator [Planococcus sp. ISL-110]|uniref:PadR family transcriptional regulator n=1 Tax=Planococcus sp. ISL-110 TaxID=2819167 RepID=UPI001BE8629D|nr:PadR family transcriptional regulator [Planococcus sp. ISL-110]MBT2570074.1 PadR family transcriptional regulator [Planococcus sp. ISL-110]